MSRTLHGHPFFLAALVIGASLSMTQSARAETTIAGSWDLAGEDARGRYQGTVKFSASGQDRFDVVHRAERHGQAVERHGSAQRTGGQLVVTLEAASMIGMVDVLEGRRADRSGMERQVITYAIAGSRLKATLASPRWTEVLTRATSARPSVAQRRVQFVLPNSSLAIANAEIVVTDADLQALLRVRTDAEGRALLPRTAPAGVAAGQTLRLWWRRTSGPGAQVRQAPRVDHTTATTAKELFGARASQRVEVRPPFATWQETYKRLLGTKDVVGFGGFRWSAPARDWDYTSLDCITAAQFIVASATDMGRRGLYRPVAIYNMLRTKAGKPLLEASGFGEVLKPAVGDRAQLARLARSGSVYRGVCRWPWKDMEWGLEGTSACGCGLHLTPRSIMDLAPQLGRVTIISMSQAKRYDGKPMDDWQLFYERSVATLIKRSDGKLYVYHQSRNPLATSRCRTFEKEATLWGTDSFGNAATGVRYIAWTVPDEQVDPAFWIGDDGREFNPRHIRRAFDGPGRGLVRLWDRFTSWLRGFRL